jgi:translation initiation factor 6 (eIF-6)
MVKDAASWLGVEVEVEKITDAKSIAMAGVMSTPGISVDGKLVHAGGLPDAAKLKGWLGT